jgi:hypothetical protein
MTRRFTGLDYSSHPSVTFQQEAKKAESSSLAMGPRVLALCRCVQRYSPIEFQATLDTWS